MIQSVPLRGLSALFSSIWASVQATCDKLQSEVIDRPRVAGANLEEIALNVFKLLAVERLTYLKNRETGTSCLEMEPLLIEYHCVSSTVGMLCESSFCECGIAINPVTNHNTSMEQAKTNLFSVMLKYSFMQKILNKNGKIWRKTWENCGFYPVDIVIFSWDPGTYRKRLCEESFGNY